MLPASGYVSHDSRVLFFCCNSPSRPDGASCATLPYRSFTVVRDHYSTSVQISRILSNTTYTFSQQHVHVPLFTHPSVSFPHDHMNNSCLNYRISTLVSIEEQVISYYSQSETYRKEFYENWFDSMVPLSENGSAAFLLKSHNNVYLGVKRTAKSVCEGCLRKRPIRYKKRDRQIRKFIGNQEVDDIVTESSSILVFFSIRIARYPSPDAPFEVTAITVGSYTFLSSMNQICPTVHASSDPLSLAGSLRLRHIHDQ